jgi:iron-sulfur cluster protein
MPQNTARTTGEYHKQIAAALDDTFLRRTLDKFAVEYRTSRDAVFAEIDGSAAIKRIADMKDAAAKRLDELYEQFKAQAERRGVKVHRAADAAEACAIIAAIAAENGVRTAVKSKSMTAEEIGLNEHLAKAGVDVCETDLGEWIIQLRGEGPSHMVMPAIHLSRGQVADEFEKATGEKQDREDVQKLVKVARRELKPKFHVADMGISGANFCIAESGAIAIVTNEGNGRLVNTLPRVHVALAGVDKLVPTVDDALAALEVLPRNATSQRLTAYTTFICGAGPCAKSPSGRKAMHVVLLDNGRSKIAADPVFSQVFRCVRCGACANVCPVFRMVGGHRMGHVYIGAIGLILTYLFHDRKIAATLCQNCIGCGSCKDVCSGGIDLPALIREVRSRLSKERGAPMLSRLASLAMKDRKVFHTLLKFMRFSQKPVAGRDGFIRHLPMALFGGQGFKSLPALAPKAFRDMWPSLRTSLDKPRLKIALFAGCAQDFAFPQHLAAAMKVFAAANVQVDFPMGQTCCGLPLAMLGETASAGEVAKQNVAAFVGEYDAIVTLCASCASHLKHGYRNLLGAAADSFSEKVMDFSSFVHDRLGLESLKLHPVGEKVAYHASCHLCRELGVKEAPRAILRAAAAYVPSKEEESCCGFGGTFSVKFPEISAELMRKKLENLAASGAACVALDCPGCAMQLGGGADKLKLGLRVAHVAEILAEAL